MPEPPRPARPLLLLDYDGTLAPIVDDPARAVPHPDVPALLPRLVARHPTVVVTGRDLATLGRLLGATPDGLRAVGLHGAEWGRPGAALADEAEAHEADPDVVARLRAAVPALPGVFVESKGALFAVHYRQAPDRAAAERAVEAWAAAVPPVFDVIRGKCVAELRPPGVSKGAAVRRLAAEHPDRTPVYVGDDVTDEEAFAALENVPGAVAVKVGDGPTRAPHRLPDPTAVAAWLAGFVAPGGSL